MRPLIWHPRTGERRDLRVDELDGDVAPLDWSPDGERLLLLQTNRAQHRLWIYDVAGDVAPRARSPVGILWVTYFGPEGEIFAAWEDAAHPTRVIALDPEIGCAAPHGIGCRGDPARPAVAHGDL